MRILWDFTFASNGGALVSLNDFVSFINNSDDSGYEHVIITRVQVSNTRPIEEVKLLVVPQESVFSRANYLLFGLPRVVREENIDFVIFPGGLPNPFINTPYAFFIRQALYFDRALDLMPLWSRIGIRNRRIVLRFVAKHANTIFAQTDYMKERIMGEFKPRGRTEKITWNVMTTQSIPTKNTFDKKRDSELKLLYVSLPEGRPYKNHINLLRGFRLLFEKTLEGKLILTCPKFGESRDKTVMKIHNTIKELGLERNVVLTGKLTREETLNLYQESDVFIFPSICESFGVPLLEAMAYELPIVGSDIPVVREVTHNCGIYFDPFDYQDIYRVLLYVSEAGLSELRVMSASVYTKYYANINVWKSLLNLLAFQINGSNGVIVKHSSGKSHRSKTK